MQEDDATTCELMLIDRQHDAQTGLHKEVAERNSRAGQSRYDAWQSTADESGKTLPSERAAAPPQPPYRPRKSLCCGDADATQSTVMNRTFVGAISASAQMKADRPGCRCGSHTQADDRCRRQCDRHAGYCRAGQLYVSVVSRPRLRSGKELTARRCKRGEPEQNTPPAAHAIQLPQDGHGIDRVAARAKPCRRHVFKSTHFR